MTNHGNGNLQLTQFRPVGMKSLGPAELVVELRAGRGICRGGERQPIITPSITASMQRLEPPPLKELADIHTCHGRASDQAISTTSSREAVGSSLLQATPSPILQSMPLTVFSSKARFGVAISF
ncbi:hypothetical protein HB775_28735 (plasmid) [Rhizobium leguminosarum bv. trifolii]|nr:hypothetical protein HB775_28735 [Rhizobium leguminosarum bv. trifolii]